MDLSGRESPRFPVAGVREEADRTALPTPPSRRSRSDHSPAIHSTTYLPRHLGPLDVDPRCDRPDQPTAERGRIHSREALDEYDRRPEQASDPRERDGCRRPRRHHHPGPTPSDDRKGENGVPGSIGKVPARRPMSPDNRLARQERPRTGAIVRHPHARPSLPGCAECEQLMEVAARSGNEQKITSRCRSLRRLRRGRRNRKVESIPSRHAHTIDPPRAHVPSRQGSERDLPDRRAS